MATIDASIPLGIRPAQIESPLNQLAQVLQIKGLQDQQALSAYTLKKAQRDDEDTNALAEVYRTAVNPDGTVNRNALFSGAAQRGLGARIPDIQKKLTEADKAQGEVDKQKVDLIDAKLKQSREMLTGVQTPEQYIQWHLANHADPVLGPVLAARGITPQQSMARIQQALQTPGGFQQLLQESALGLAKFTELNKPTVHMQDVGGASNVVSVPGLGGPPTVLSSTQKTNSPDAVLSSNTSIENNKRTVNASLANAAATRDVAKATRDAAQIQQNQSTEMKLGDDWRAQSKGFKEVADAHRTITTALDSATKSPAATLAGATKFMKLLDPGSVVRESELGMALNSSGIFDRAGNYIKTLQTGKTLTPTQVADFKTIANQIYAAAQQQQQTIDANYRRQAQAYGLRPELVVQDLGQNKPIPADKPAGGVPEDIAAILAKHGRKGL